MVEKLILKGCFCKLQKWGKAWRKVVSKVAYFGLKLDIFRKCHDLTLKLII